MPSDEYLEQVERERRYKGRESSVRRANAFEDRALVAEAKLEALVKVLEEALGESMPITTAHVMLTDALAAAKGEKGGE